MWARSVRRQHRRRTGWAGNRRLIEMMTAVKQMADWQSSMLNPDAAPSAGIEAFRLRTISACSIGNTQRGSLMVESQSRAAEGFGAAPGECFSGYSRRA